MPMSENERLEKVAEAQSDLSQGQARLELAAARNAEEKRRWSALLQLSQQVYDSGHYTVEAGYLLAKAQGHHGHYLEQVETFREVRKLDASAVSDAEIQEALGLAVSQVDPRQAERRLELRLELARLAPEHPRASADRIRGDLVELVHHHHREGNWEAMLEGIEALASSPMPGRSSPVEFDFLRAVAHWKLGDKARAKEMFERYVEGAHPTRTQARLSKVIQFFSSESEHDFLVSLYERVLGRASRQMDQERLGLIMNLAELLLLSGDPADRQRGETLMRYHVDQSLALVPERRRDNVYAQVRRLAQRHKLHQLAADMLEQAVESGTASPYMVESLFQELVRGGSTDKAKALADKYLQTHQSASDLWVVAGWARGAGQWKITYEYMTQALEALPRQDDWWFEFARVALRLDKKKQAVRAIRKYLATGSTSSWDVQSAAGFLTQAGMQDEAIEVVSSYHQEHPYDSRTTTYLVSLMIADGQRARAMKVLRALADDERTSRHQLLDVARFVQREIGEKEAFDFFLIAGERGEPQAFVTAASIALSTGDLDGYDKLSARYLEASALSLYDYQRLWYLLRNTDHEKRKIALLEKMLDAPGPGHRQNYRVLLTQYYIGAGRGAEAFALWEKADTSRSQRTFRGAFALANAPKVHEELIEQYRKKYPDDQASSWVLFFVAEQHYRLHVERQKARGASAAQTGLTHDADALLEEARRLYGLALATIEHNPRDYLYASSHFEGRQMPDLAEEAMAGYLKHRPDDPEGWLGYAKLLLRQGRHKAAIQVMYRFISTSDDTGSAAVSAANVFRRHLRDDEAEAFYKMALAYHQNNELDEREHRSILTSVSDGLGHLYLTSGRIEEFLELTSDFYAKYMGQHPHLEAHERHIDLNGLESRGQWSEFVQRVEQLPKGASQAGLSERHAKALWYLGRRKDAWKVFEEHHSQRGYNTGQRWLQLAEFLEARGGEVLAATAYDRAVRHEGRYLQGGALLARAGFLTRQGHYQAAIQDFYAAKKTSRYAGQVRNVMVSAFAEVGRQDLAWEAIRREGSPFQAQAQGRGNQAAIDLEGVSADNVVERAKALASKGHKLEEIVNALSKTGRFEAIATLIDERLGAKDINRAANLIFAHADALAAVDRLAPIIAQLEGTHLDVDKRGVERLLVDHHLQTGQYERALGLLQQESGFSSTHSTVALQLALGREQSLSNTLSYLMKSYLHSSRTRRNLPLAVEFVRFGQHQRLSSVLARFTEFEQTFGQVADTYVSDLLERRGAGAVVDFLRRTAEQLAERGEVDEGDNKSTINTGRALVRGVALLAASGYAGEARALVDDLPVSVRKRDDVGGLIERVTLFLDEQLSADDEDAGERRHLDAPVLNKPHDSWRELAADARLLMLRGNFEAAEELLVGAFEAMSGDDTTLPGLGAVSAGQREHALRELLRLYRTTGDHTGVDTLVSLWLGHVGRDNFSTTALIDELSAQGFYQHAARVARQVAEDFPTGPVLQKAILAAANADDRETVEALMPIYWRHLGSNGREIGQYTTGHLVRRFDPKIAQALLEPHLEARPRLVANRVSEIVVALRGEEVERGRALIADYVDEFEGSDRALSTLVAELNQANFPVEVARVIAPSLESDAGLDDERDEDLEDDLPGVELLRHFAQANAAIGRYEDAARYLDAIVSQAANPQLEATSLSRGCTLAGHQALGLELAERAFSEGGSFSQAYLARGLARLANHKEGALDDLARGIKGRQGNSQVLSEIVVVALRAEQYEVAETYLTQLIRLPQVSTSSYGHPLREAIEAVQRAEKERWGVAFFDRTIPELMQGAYLVDSFQWTKLIGELLTDAGMRERADAWFDRAIMFHRLDSDSAHTIDSLLDARALNLVVNGGDVDRAVALSRRALASTSRLRPSFLVTLALAERRRGDIEKAHDTFRQAVRGGHHFTGSHRSIDAYLTRILDGGSRHLRSTSHARRDLSSPISAYQAYRYNSSRHNSSIRGYGHIPSGSRGGIAPRQPIRIHRP